jgi:hypothetical protein
MTYEDRYHSFAQYLKNRQIEAAFVPAEIINDLPDEAVMESYRLQDASSDNSKEYYSKEQEHAIIMEYNSNETIYQAFEEIKHSSHIDTAEEELFKEFPDRAVNISVSEMNQGQLDSVLKDLEGIGVKIEKEALNGVLKEICSMFALWVLEGCKYYIKEVKDKTFELDFERVCPACLLKETLYNFRTLLGWAIYTKNGDFNGNELRSNQDAVISKATDCILDIAIDGLTIEAPNHRKFHKIIGRLFDIFFGYSMNLPLISCWMLGKELAQRKYSENKETHNFLSYTHDYFLDKYSCLKPEIEAQFFKDVENYLRTLQLEQLEILFDAGFPVQMSRKQFNKIDKLLKRLIIAMKRSEEVSSFLS